jgi:hypothetical protein
MDEDMIEKAEIYAARRERHLAGRLGFGIHGIVFVLEGNDLPGASALKIHHLVEPYVRERDVYRRLAEKDVTTIGGFHVPAMIDCDDVLCALEITMVQPPFVLDFAGAWLDWPPGFSDEIWEERLAKWAEEFGEDWTKARAIVAELEEFGIYMLDPSPSNIRFR